MPAIFKKKLEYDYWISVNDRLPNCDIDGDWVLVYFEQKDGMGEGIFKISSWNGLFWENEFGKNINIGNFIVTYWMPFPKPPKK